MAPGGPAAPAATARNRMSLFANLFRNALARITRGQNADASAPQLSELGESSNRRGGASHQDVLSAGLEKLRAGDLVGAEKYFEAAAGRLADPAEAQLYLGVSLIRQKRYEDALDCFILALHLRPDLAEARFQLGLAQIHLEQFDQAIENFQAVVDLKPDYADAHCNLGYALYKHREELDQAEAHLRRALELDPRKLEAQTNLAIVLDHRGHSDEALGLYERILSITPEDNEVRLNRSLILLARGDYARGWAEYEARRALGSHRKFPFPEWDGSALDGRVVLIHAEQGLGDEIMFASCVGDVIARARHCFIECHSKLEKIFRRSFPVATVHGALQTETLQHWLEREPKIDCKIGTGSLPLHFRRHRADFPVHTGYLRADPGRAEYWRSRLAALGAGPKVGISWRGGAVRTRRYMRSVPLEHWTPLLSLPGMHFVSLQYGDCQDEIEAVRKSSGVRVHHWTEAIEDYDETASLVSSLDLVISVQTAVIHLGGALGRPVWVLVSARPEWRYQEAGESLPWYPSVRLIRQAAADQWTPVIDEARQRLRRWPA